jgi:NitT/TauT family transport system substrate-binding protein
MAPLLPGCHKAGGPLAVGYMNNLTHAQPLVGATSGRWAAALGLPMMAFPAGPAVMEALSAGTLLAGFMGPSAAVNAFVRSRGKRGLVLRGNASGGASLVVQRDLPITAPEHLRGRLLTASQIASTPDVSLRTYLAQHRLAPQDRGGDVVLLPMPSTEAFQTLRRRQIAGAWAQEPWASRMVAQAGGRRMLDERELWPGGRFPASLLVTTRRALDEHPEKIERLVSLLDEETARMKALADGGLGEVGNALSKALGRALPEEVLRDAWGRFELVTDPMEDGLKEVARRMQAIGYLPGGGSTEGLLVAQRSEESR